MSTYDPRRWTSHLFDVDGSMFREILGRVMACVVWSAIVVGLYFYGPKLFAPLFVPSTAHSLLGTVLGLLLVFRTNSSYDRFWEGRKQWGAIVNECRNLARQTSIWLAADPALAREIINWTIAVPFAMKQRLRNQTGLGIVSSDLSQSDVAQAESSVHIPLAVLRIITARLMLARERNLIDGLQLTSLDQNVQLIVDACGACDRIRSTPMPFAYAVHLRRVLIVYCITLPLALVREFGWDTIPTTLLISYSLFGVEEIGVEIEDPFGLTKNDLPLESICAGIESALGEIRDSVSAEGSR